jgi:ABC-type multidrug transport system fused ATPase/permease subunit
MSHALKKSTSQYSAWEFIKDLKNLVSPYRGQFLAGFFLRLSSDIVGLYPVWALSRIVFLLTQPELAVDREHTIYWLLAGWLIAVVYFAVAHAFAKWFGYRVSERVALDSRIQALRHIFYLDIAWQEKENTGNKLKRIDHGSRSLDKTVRIFFDVIVEASFNSVGMLLIFLYLGWDLGISLFIFMVIYYILSSFLTRHAAKQSYIVNVIEEDLEGLSFESLNSIKTVKSLSIQQTVLAKLQHYVDQTFRAIEKRITLFRIRSGVLNSFYLIFQVSMITYIVTQIFNGRFTPDILILFVGYIRKVEEAVSELAEVTHEIVISKIQYHRLKEILNIKPTIEGLRKKPQFSMPENWQQIEFKNVSFRYEKRAVLNKFNLKIKRGQKIGIVGLSGAGKSTLFNLLLDLYEDYEGEILIDDTPLKEIDRHDYINHLSVVLQETELFNVSLKENIIIGSQPGIFQKDEKLEEAMRTSYLNDVIQRLPAGAETMIGEKGVKLSGGERQRLGIARAIYRQPDLLLMDEATSHLDVESEKKIQASLHLFFNQVTAVVIAHRLSTIREMDEILVMQGGRIVERGTFEELLAQKGHFANLWEKQKL